MNLSILFENGISITFFKCTIIDTRYNIQMQKCFFEPLRKNEPSKKKLCFKILQHYKMIDKLSKTGRRYPNSDLR